MALIAFAVWVVTPPWRAERSGRLHGTARGRPGMKEWLGGARARWRPGAAARRRRSRERLRLVHALAALAADLQAGQPPTSALGTVGGPATPWPAGAAAARMGEDVVSALTQDGAQNPVLLHLAACWQVAIESGTGLAAAVAQLADSARAAEDVRVQLEAELAGPRATARTLAFLPLVGMGFGVMMGADPLGWLLGSPIGWGCLVMGSALTALGAWWTARIAARVEAML